MQKLLKKKVKFALVERKYGIEEKDWRLIWDAQNGKCEICGRGFEEDKNYMGAHVDHCHDTGEIRGLLCLGCNAGLGSFRDNIESLRSAIEYLS